MIQTTEQLLEVLEEGRGTYHVAYTGNDCAVFDPAGEVMARLMPTAEELYLFLDLAMTAAILGLQRLQDAHPLIYVSERAQWILKSAASP